MAGVVLGAGHQAMLLCSPDKDRSNTRHHARVIAVGAEVNNRIVGIVVHVHYRGESNMNAQSPRFQGSNTPLLIGIFLVKGSGHCHVGGEPGGPLDLLSYTLLEVRRHQQGNGSQALEPLEVGKGAVHAAPESDQASNLVFGHPLFHFLTIAVVGAVVESFHSHHNQLSYLLAERQF